MSECILVICLLTPCLVLAHVFRGDMALEVKLMSLGTGHDMRRHDSHQVFHDPTVYAKKIQPMA